MHQTTPTPVHPLADRWVRVDRDGGRPPHLGVLTRASADPDHPGLWHWGLRTPTGYLAGGPHLPAQALTRAHTADIARARRGLARRQAWLEGTIDPDTGIVPRAVAQGLADIDHDRALLADLA